MYTCYHYPPGSCHHLRSCSVANTDCKSVEAVPSMNTRLAYATACRAYVTTFQQKTLNSRMSENLKYLNTRTSEPLILISNIWSSDFINRHTNSVGVASDQICYLYQPRDSPLEIHLGVLSDWSFPVATSGERGSYQNRHRIFFIDKEGWNKYLNIDFIAIISISTYN